MSEYKLTPQELRIGNLIEVICDDNILPIEYRSTIEQCNIHHLKDILEGILEYKYKPLPLTEEWLLKFGAIRSQTSDKYFTLGDNIAISTADDKFKVIKGNFVCQIVLREVKYVHTFQNLIFDLSDEELTIK